MPDSTYIKVQMQDDKVASKEILLSNSILTA